MIVNDQMTCGLEGNCVPQSSTDDISGHIDLLLCNVYAWKHFPWPRKTKGKREGKSDHVIKELGSECASHSQAKSTHEL
jgi:hypothetical protein